MKALKKLCLYLHRYSGWIVGFFFFVMCLTGAILVMQPELEYLAEPARFRIAPQPGAVRLSLDEFVTTFERLEAGSFEEPTQVHVQRLKTYANNPRKTWYVLAAAQNEHDSWTYIAYVDPYTGRGVSYGPGKLFEFFRTVRSWHTSLKIRSVGALNRPVAWLVGAEPERVRNYGAKILGLVSLAAAFTILTGLVRWLPLKWRGNKSLGKSFVPVLNRGSFRANFSLHNVGGFYAALLLLCLSLSGAWIAVPRFQNLCDKLVGYQPEPGATARGHGHGGHGHGAAAGGAFRCERVLDSTVSLDEIAARQNKITGACKGYDVMIPPEGSDAALTMAPIWGASAFCFPDTYYWNQYTGDALGKTSFHDQSSAQQFRTLIVPFHRGRIFGALSRYLLFAACLIGVVLSVTGYVIMSMRFNVRAQATKKKRGDGEGDESRKGRQE